MNYLSTYLTILFGLNLISIGLAQTKYQKDFAYYLKAIDEDFAYFNEQKMDWNKVKTIYQPRLKIYDKPIVVLVG